MPRSESIQLGGTKPTLEARKYGTWAPTGKPSLEPGFIDREGLFTFVKSPTEELLSHIHDLTKVESSERIAPIEVVRNVHRRNPISFWAIYRSADTNRTAPQF